MNTRPAELDELPSVGQLRQRVRHIRNHLNRHLDALATDRPGPIEAAMRRARIHESQAALELAIAELQAHPDWSR